MALNLLRMTGQGISQIRVMVIVGFLCLVQQIASLCAGFAAQRQVAQRGGPINDVLLGIEFACQDSTD